MGSHKRKEAATLKRAELGEGSAELAKAFEALALIEMAPMVLSEPDTLTTNDGTRIDLKAPWPLPCLRREKWTP